MKGRLGKIIYLPPEKCYTNTYIEETPYGFKLYREGESKAFKVLPFSAIKSIEYYRSE